MANEQTDLSLAQAREKAEQALDIWLQPDSTRPAKEWLDALDALLKHVDFEHCSLKEQANTLIWAGEGFREHYRVHRFALSLESAIGFLRLAESRAEEGLTSQVRAHGSLGGALHDKYLLTGNAEHMRAARRHSEIALGHTAEGSLEWAIASMNYAVIVLDDRSDPENIGMALTAFEQSAAAAQGDDALYRLHFGNWAAALEKQYERSANNRDIERALDCQRKAFELTPESDADWPRTARNLGRTLRLSYKGVGDQTKLDEGIELLERVRIQLPEHHWTMKLVDIERAKLLLEKSKLSRDVDALANVIETFSGMLKESQEEVVQEGWNILGELYNFRYQVSGHLPDLEAEIGCHKHITATMNATNPNFAESQNRLGNAFIERFGLLRVQEDLENGICAFEKAVGEEKATEAARAIYRNNLGNALYYRYRESRQGPDLDSAIKEYRVSLEGKAIQADAQSRHLANLAGALSLRGQNNHNRGDLDEAALLAEKALKLVDQESEDYRVRSQVLGDVLFHRWVVFQESHDLEGCIGAYRAAFDANRREMFRHGGPAHMLGKALFARADPDDLREAWDLLLKCWEQIHISRLTADASGRLAIQGKLAEVTNLLVECLIRHGVLPNLPPEPEKFEAFATAMVMAELTKSMSLNDYLGLVDQAPPPEIPAEWIAGEQNFIESLRADDALGQAMSQTLQFVPEQDRRTERMRNRVISYGELLRLWGFMEERGEAAAEYVKRRRGGNLNWENLSALVEESSDELALLSLYVGFSYTYLFVLRRGWGRPGIVREPVGEKDLQLLVGRFAREIPSYNRVRREETWHRPFERLFSQVQHWVADAQYILISPHGASWAFPYSVLSHRSGWTKGGAHKPIVTMPGLGALFRIRPAQEFGHQEALVVGDPMRNLPFASSEATAVAGLLGTEPLLGKNATRDRVRQRIVDAPIVHIASHARFSENDPLSAGIELHDGRLTCRDLLSMNLRANLVVLSGCETGRLAELRGEELAGLGQAFLQAGARMILMSLWRVDDEATSELMGHFYAGYKKGRRTADALAAAIDAVSKMPGREHPFYWASFFLMGDWQT